MPALPPSESGDHAQALAALDATFSGALTGLDLADIAASPDPTLVVDGDLLIRGYNQAYIDFAHANGLPAIEANFGVGTSLLAAFSEPARALYAQAYRNALDRQEVFHQSCECSSPSEYREYLLSAYPIAKGIGLLLCHHLVAADPIPMSERRARSPEHLSPNDLIVQCCHCREVRNFQHENRWDWVPDLIKQMPTNVSHTFCPRCLDHYYPDLGEKRSRSRWGLSKGRRSNHPRAPMRGLRSFR